LDWLLIFFFVCVALAAGQTKLPPAVISKVDYEKQIQPKLAEKSYCCHGFGVQQAQSSAGNGQRKRTPVINLGGHNK
jgi:hypothetical protein